MRTQRAAVSLLLLRVAFAQAPQYLISTYAGGAPVPTPSPGRHMWIGFPEYVAADAAGNIYFTSIYETSFNSVFEMDASGVVTRVAGTGRPGFSGDGGPAASAQLNRPVGLTVDAAGNLYIADYGRIRRVSPDGIIGTVVEQISGPLTVDRAGNLLVADSYFTGVDRTNVVVKIAP